MADPVSMGQAVVVPANGAEEFASQSIEQGLDRIDRFRAIFDRSMAAQEPQAVGGVDQVDRQRAIDTLDLGAVAEPGRTGDTILGGLSKLRGVFDLQQGRVAQAISVDASAGGNLFRAQFEIVQYTMLVDVTSKLTGKATQSFDTLMKGQ